MTGKQHEAKYTHTGMQAHTGMHTHRHTYMMLTYICVI